MGYPHITIYGGGRLIEAKLVTATSSTMNKLRYLWEVSSLPHTDACQLDSIIDHTMVKSTNNMNSFPRKLLHIPRALGGLGLPQFSKLGETGKLSKLFNCIRTYQLFGKAAQGLLSREARKLGFHASTGQQLILHSTSLPKDTTHQYVDGPCQWLETLNLTLCRHGHSDVDSPACMLPMLFPNDHELRQQCATLQLYTLSDLTESDETGQLIWKIPEVILSIRISLPPP